LDRLQVCLTSSAGSVHAFSWSQSASRFTSNFAMARAGGVSKWLFIGELASALGFLTYSILLGLPVYIVTNSVMVLNAIAGLVITLYHRRREGT
ncbi:MAG: hypothetical protein ACJ74Z_03565, partial [Bryobacteraceae bacterium]